MYGGETAIQILLAHREGEIPSLCSVRDDVPAELDAVFQKMVAKSADDRYQSMTEVIADLEALAVSTSPSVIRHDDSGKQHTIACRVRRGSVVVEYDGNKIIDWTGDFARFEGERSEERTFYLSGGDNATFYTHKLELVPVSGHGRPFH